MEHRTMVGLYDYDVPSLNLWNIPAPPRFRAGDKIIVINGLACDGAKGSVSSVLPARATCSMKTEPHHYYVKLLGSTKERQLFSEEEIKLL